MCVCLCVNVRKKHFFFLSFCPLEKKKNRFGTVLANLSPHVNWMHHF